MTGIKKLEGMTVVSLESRHAKTLADLILVHGGCPVSAPSLKEVPLESNVEVFRFAEAWFRGDVDFLILLTGVGTKAMVEVLRARYEEAKIMDRLRQTVLLPRGPKPIRVLNEWRVPFALTVPEPNTWRELLAAIDEAVQAGRLPSLKNKNVAVQEYGVENFELVRALEQRGCRVIRVPVYRWTLPDDIGPLEQAVRQIRAGSVHGVVFTTAVQIDHLLQVAGRSGALDTFKQSLLGCVIASVGPDTTDALRQRGVEIDLQPESPKMGPLIALLAEKGREIWRKKKEAGMRGVES